MYNLRRLLFNAARREREEVLDADSAHPPAVPSSIRNSPNSPDYPITRFRCRCPVPVVMDADRMGRTLTRIAHEILERNRGVEELALVGIRTRGVPLARRLAQAIRDINGHEVPTGALDITLYRDDLMRHAVGAQPVVRSTEIPFSIDDKRILLVDDVLYTGPDDSRGARRADRVRPAEGDSAGRAGRPRPSRAADQGRLRRQEPADVARRRACRCT